MILYGRGTKQPALPIVHYENTLVQFGDFCSIGSPLTIISGQHPPVDHPRAVTQYPFAEELGLDYFPCRMDGRVDVGHDVWIGQGVTLLDGVHIGNGAIIGACAVVARDVPDYAVVVGNPARVVKLRFSPTIIAQLLQIAWWDWPMEKIHDAIASMRSIDTFVARYDKIKEHTT